MSTKEIVHNIVNKDFYKAKEEIHDELKKKTHDSIENMKPEVMKKAYSTYNESDELQEEIKLTSKDKKVIVSFINKEPMESKKLMTDGEYLHGLWMGGDKIAYWDNNKIFMNDLGSKAGDTIQNIINKEAPRNFISDK